MIYKQSQIAKVTISAIRKIKHSWAIVLPSSHPQPAFLSVLLLKSLIYCCSLHLNNGWLLEHAWLKTINKLSFSFNSLILIWGMVGNGKCAVTAV